MAEAGWRPPFSAGVLRLQRQSVVVRQIRYPDFCVEMSEGSGNTGKSSILGILLVQYLYCSYD
jgi:hypothetical protein